MTSGSRFLILVSEEDFAADGLCRRRRRRIREKARHGTGARAGGRDKDTRDGKITAVNAVRMPCQSVTRRPLAASLGLLVVHNRSFVSCFMSAAAPRAENMLFATDTHSDCISATNAVAVCAGVRTSRPQRGRGNGQRVCQLRTRRKSGSSRADCGTWTFTLPRPWPAARPRPRRPAPPTKTTDPRK